MVYERIKLNSQIKQIEHWIDPDFIENEMHIKKIPLCLIAYKRAITDSSPASFYNRFAHLNKLIDEQKFVMDSSMMAIYHDNWWEFDSEKADIEVCAKIIDTGSAENVTREWGNFLALTTIHYGPYETMNQTYKKALDWCEENNFSFIGKATEVYIIDIILTDDPTEYVTELILPIKNKKE